MRTYIKDALECFIVIHERSLIRIPGESPPRAWFGILCRALFVGFVHENFASKARPRWRMNWSLIPNHSFHMAATYVHSRSSYPRSSVGDLHKFSIYLIFLIIFEFHRLDEAFLFFLTMRILGLVSDELFFDAFPSTSLPPGKISPRKSSQRISDQDAAQICERRESRNYYVLGEPQRSFVWKHNSIQ